MLFKHLRLGTFLSMKMILFLPLLKQVQRSILKSKVSCLKNVWKPTVNEQLEPKMEPDNVMDKYAVRVKNNTSMAGCLPLGKNGKFGTIIFYFIRADGQSCYNWQRSQSWRRVRNASSLQVEDLISQEKWLKFFVKIFNVVQKRANKKLLLYLYLFFHLLCLQSHALNSLIPNVFANSKAFSLSMIQSIRTSAFFPSGKPMKNCFIYLVVAPTVCDFSWRKHSFLFQRSCQFVLIFHPCRKSVFRDSILCCNVFFCHSLFQVF